MAKEAAAAAAAASSSSPIPWKYLVFLSFRGEDMRYNFTGHLCRALRQKGIKTFMDDYLSRGEEISPALLKVIEESRISVIVFSENYASSRWCLDELVKILDCKKSNQQMVIPVFYKVSPSDVRNQKGCFGDGLAGLECKYKDNVDKIHKWRPALSEAANFSGWSLLDENEDESKLIHNIVEGISAQLINRTYLHVADYPVGIESRAQEINNLLHVGRSDVRMVGLWGIGGIGKSAIAKAVYNLISHNFEGSCFLSSVRESSMTDKGLAKLQKTLLYEILRGHKLKVANVDKGITLIKERLSSKRILLVLDDVNDLKQLCCLAGGSDGWFGMGSRIIITTRDKKLLTLHHHNILIYEVKELNYCESLELFSWNAFKSKGPLDGYAELADHAIWCAQGLPLVLRVLGSHLYRKSIDKWQAILDGLIKSREIRLNMRNIHITGFGEGFKNLTKLTSIDLSGCQYLTRISDFSGVPNLVRLDLNYCTNLTEVDPSVGFLNKLEELSLVGCYNLTVFPTTISLKSLETFNLSQCKKFEIFPEIVGKMESLRNLELNGTAIKDLPPSIENLTGLEFLKLIGCENIANLPLIIFALPGLLFLDFSGCPNLETIVSDECNLSDIDTLANFGCSSKLKEFFLSNSKFENLPACISKFVWLEVLDLCGCKRLREILELPPNIRRINVRDCILLEIFPTLSEMILVDGDMRLIRRMDISNCQRLCENLALDVSMMASVLLHQAGKCYEVLNIILSGSEVPNWFSCRKDVREVTTDPGCICEFFIEIPRTFKRKNTGLVFCATFESTQKFSFDCSFYTQTAVNGVLINDKDVFYFSSKETDAAHVWLKYVPLPAHIKSKVDEGGDQSKPYLCRVRVYRAFGEALLLNGCGVHLGNFSMPEDGDEDDDDVGGEVGPRKKKRMLAIKS
ncbi:hypothetical protein ACFX15_030951 [Malus domestica]